MRKEESLVLNQEQKNAIVNEKKVEAVEQVLGKPFAADLTDYVRKIRMNLLALSFIELTVVLLDINIQPSATFLGLTFIGVTDQKLLIIMLVVTFYTFFHFCWCSVDNWIEWRLRLTGTKLSFQTTGTFSDGHADYTSDPRQSTLYNWWLSQSKVIASWEGAFKVLRQQLKSLEEINAGLPKDPNVLNSTQRIQEVILKVQELKESVNTTQRVIESPRIIVSLKRFDNAASLMLSSQNMRWLLLELLLPILLGGAAITVLSVKIFT